MISRSKTIAGLVIYIGLVLSAFIVPFTFFSSVYSFFGSFLYWTVFAVFSMVIAAIMSRRWE